MKQILIVVAFAGVAAVPVLAQQPQQVASLELLLLGQVLSWTR